MNTTAPRIKRTLLAFASLGLVASPLAQGQTVAWGSSVSFNPIAFNSDGTVDNQANLWMLGYFDDGFIPDATNYADWVANWNPVSSLTPEEDPLDPGSGTLVNYPEHHFFDDPDPDGFDFWSVSVNTYNVGPEAGGKQAYIFAYNDANLIGTPDGEALLFREDGLLLPTVPNQVTFDIANNPLDTADDDFTVIWGRVDRDTVNLGGIVRGGGIITALEGTVDGDSATGGASGDFITLFSTYEAQFATWPIPEPSTALLAALGLLAMFRRRR